MASLQDAFPEIYRIKEIKEKIKNDIIEKRNNKPPISFPSSIPFKRFRQDWAQYENYENLQPVRPLENIDQVVENTMKLEEDHKNEHNNNNHNNNNHICHRCGYADLYNSLLESIIYVLCIIMLLLTFALINKNN